MTASLRFELSEGFVMNQSCERGCRNARCPSGSAAFIAEIVLAFVLTGGLYIISRVSSLAGSLVSSMLMCPLPYIWVCCIVCRPSSSIAVEEVEEGGEIISGSIASPSRSEVRLEYGCVLPGKEWVKSSPKVTLPFLLLNRGLVLKSFMGCSLWVLVNIMGFVCRNGECVLNEPPNTLRGGMNEDGMDGWCGVDEVGGPLPCCVPL